MRKEILQDFLDSLALGLELEVSFRGRRYFIQGWDWTETNLKSGPHIEMFELVDGKAAGYVFQYDASSRGKCTEKFLAAKLWDGMSFSEAEPEIEWEG